MKPNLSNPECRRIIAEGDDPQRRLDMHEKQFNRYFTEWIQLPYSRTQERHNTKWHVEFHRGWIKKLTE